MDYGVFLKLKTFTSNFLYYSFKLFYYIYVILPEECKDAIINMIKYMYYGNYLQLNILFCNHIVLKY